MESRRCGAERCSLKDTPSHAGTGTDAEKQKLAEWSCSTQACAMDCSSQTSTSPCPTPSACWSAWASLACHTLRSGSPGRTSRGRPGQRAPWGGYGGDEAGAVRQDARARQQGAGLGRRKDHAATQRAHSGRCGGGEVAPAGRCEVAGDDAGRESADGATRPSRTCTTTAWKSSWTWSTRWTRSADGARTARPARPISANAAWITSTRWSRSASSRR